MIRNKVVFEKRLPDFVEIFVAELQPIMLCVAYAVQKTIKSISFTDSLSAIRAIQKSCNG